MIYDTYNIRWVELRQKSPINIDEISIKGEDIMEELYLDENRDINEERKRFLFIKSQLFFLISSLLGLLRKSEIIKKETEELLFYRIQDNLGRMFGRLDDIKDQRLLTILDKEKDKQQLALNAIYFIDEAMTFLISNIYVPLKIAIERCGKDQKKFIYYLYESIALNSSTFGSVTRNKGDFRTGMGSANISGSYVPTAEFMMSQKGQEELNEEFEKQIGVFIKKKEMPMQELEFLKEGEE